MAKLPQQRLVSSGQVWIAPHSAQPADVIELIMADHRKVRRLREVLDDAVRYGPGSGSGWMLADAWERLADLLESHTLAEEEISYLPMFGTSSNAGERRLTAVADHDDIREAISEASLQQVGSALWWGAARAALEISADHLDHEERDMLAGWLPRLAVSRRHELGRQWQAFSAAWRLDAAAESHRDFRAASSGATRLPERRWRTTRM